MPLNLCSEANVNLKLELSADAMKKFFFSVMTSSLLHHFIQINLDAMASYLVWLVDSCIGLLLEVSGISSYSYGGMPFFRV